MIGHSLLTTAIKQPYLAFTLVAHLPRKPGTMILITSRDRDAAYDLVHQKHNHILEIDCMDGTDTKALLDVKLDDPQAVEAEKEQLNRKLDSIPPAITQAASYIKRRRMITILKYLNLLDVCEENPRSVLNDDGGDSGRDPEVSNAVFRTWQISLDLIRMQHPMSANLLSIMAMFDRQGIPDFLFRFEAEPSVVRADGSKDGDRASSDDHPEALAVPSDPSSSSVRQPSSRSDHGTGTGCQARLAASPVCDLALERLAHEDGVSSDSNDKSIGPFDDAVEVLLALSLVKMEESGKTFQMHRLVQLATRRWLKHQNSYQYFSEKALDILILAYPRDIDKDWKICQALEPHAESVHERAYQSKMSRLDHARLSRFRTFFFRIPGLIFQR